MKEDIRIRRANLRAKLIEELGGMCICCGLTTNLVFDHIINDTKKTIRNIYSIDPSYVAKTFQLLCKPCNSSKNTGTVCKLHLIHKYKG